MIIFTDPSNSPSWTCISGEEDVSEQPAVLMKHLPVDMPRYFTKVCMKTKNSYVVDFEL